MPAPLLSFTPKQLEALLRKAKAAGRDEVLAGFNAVADLNGSAAQILKGVWEEDKHPRDHGRFAHVAGAAGGTTAESPPAVTGGLRDATKLPAGEAVAPPPPPSALSAAVAEAVAAAGPEHGHRLALAAVSAAHKAHAALVRLTPAMWRALEVAGAVFDTHTDLSKFGWSPGSSGTAAGDVAATGDPVRAAVGVPAHVAATLAARVLGSGLAWARQQAGLPPMVKKAMDEPDYEGAGRVLAEAFAAVAAELGLEGAPDGATVAAALRAGAPLLKSWSESDHPRGQPENAGEFAPKGGGGSAARPDAPAAVREHGRQTAAVRAGLFGDHDPATLAAAACGGPGAAVNLTASDGMLTAEVEGPGYSAVREFERTPEGVVCTNNSIRVDPGAGVSGAGLFAAQVAALRELGVVKIKTLAVRKDHDNPAFRMVGHYVWPRLGYDGTIRDAQWDALPPDLKAQVEANPAGSPFPRSVQSLYATPEGRAWWREHGATIGLTFDLAAGSRSMRVLEAYRAERANRGAA